VLLSLIGSFLQPLPDGRGSEPTVAAKESIPCELAEQVVEAEGEIGWVLVVNESLTRTTHSLCALWRRWSCGGSDVESNETGERFGGRVLCPLFAAEEVAVCEERVPGIGFFAASEVRNDAGGAHWPGAPVHRRKAPTAVNRRVVGSRPA
jgi:hypothetical protein